MAPSLITRTALIDDDGSDTTGTIIDNNEIQKIYDAIDQLASGSAPYTTFEYGGNLKVDGILTAGGLTPPAGNLSVTGNLLVTGRLQIGGTTFGQATAPALRIGTLTAQSKQAMEVTSGDNAAWAAVRASAFISTESGTSLADLTVTGATNFAGGITSSSGIIQSVGVIYPGRVDVAGAQASWYLGSHGSYGLYSNTGLYIAQGLTVAAGVYVAGDAVVGGLLTAGRRCTARAPGASVVAVNGDFILYSGGTFTVTLPSPVDGGIVDVKNYGAGVITVVAPGGVYLDYPATSYQLVVPNQSVTVVACAGNWWIR